MRHSTHWSMMIRIYTCSLLVQIMACGLLSASPLSDRMLFVNWSPRNKFQWNLEKFGIKRILAFKNIAFENSKSKWRPFSFIYLTVVSLTVQFYKFSFANIISLTSRISQQVFFIPPPLPNRDPLPPIVAQYHICPLLWLFTRHLQVIVSQKRGLFLSGLFAQMRERWGIMVIPCLPRKHSLVYFSIKVTVILNSHLNADVGIRCRAHRSMGPNDACMRR